MNVETTDEERKREHRRGQPIRPAIIIEHLSSSRLSGSRLDFSGPAVRGGIEINSHICSLSGIPEVRDEWEVVRRSMSGKFSHVRAATPRRSRGRR